ncbi:MAG: YbaB/EbfC family nucleoid-associated protein [Beggiatoa sp. IS2]|nr:MAG: YbaB/EbfC family nucleoid-associated protein [Beggiatoa sp. IS2]
MMKGGISNLMKQFQQMQDGLKTAQEELQHELASKEIVGKSGGDMVTVIMNGRYDVQRVSIEPSLLTEDKEMLEDLIAAAVNDAVHKVEKEVEKISQDKFSNMTGLNLPGGLKLPF